MTAHDVAKRFEIKWNGGPLLPPREGGSSLTDAARPSRRDHGSQTKFFHRRTVMHGAKPRKYSEATRDAARALYGKGVTYQQIAERLQIPFGTIYNWLTDAGGRAEVGAGRAGRLARSDRPFVRAEETPSRHTAGGASLHPFETERTQR